MGELGAPGRSSFRSMRAPGPPRVHAGADAESAAGPVHEYGRRRARPRPGAGRPGAAGSGPRRAVGGRCRWRRRRRGDGVRVVRRRPDDLGPPRRGRRGAGRDHAAADGRTAGAAVRRAVRSGGRPGDATGPGADHRPGPTRRDAARDGGARRRADGGRPRHPARHGGLQRCAARTRPRRGDRRPATAVAGRGARRPVVGRRLRAAVPPPVPGLVRSAPRLAGRAPDPSRSRLAERGSRPPGWRRSASTGPSCT